MSIKIEKRIVDYQVIQEQPAVEQSVTSVQEKTKADVTCMSRWNARPCCVVPPTR